MRGKTVEKITHPQTGETVAIKLDTKEGTFWAEIAQTLRAARRRLGEIVSSPESIEKIANGSLLALGGS